MDVIQDDTSTVSSINKEHVYHSLKPYQETYDTDLLLRSQAMEAPPSFLTPPKELMGRDSTPPPRFHRALESDFKLHVYSEVIREI